MNSNSESAHTLILGIGNTLMGDEGIGVRVVEQLSALPLPEGVSCLDGGTGSFLLLEPMQKAGRVILIDATVDGSPAGTVSYLRPRFAKDYPRTLTAHDIGLKDLLDAFYLMGDEVDVRLFAVSIDPLGEMCLDLSPVMQGAIPVVVSRVLEEVSH
jgi:hydrogenase maturation protease